MADQATDQSILYKAIPTSIGLTKIQLAMTTGVDLILATIGYGDGGGAPIVPSPEQTSLVNQIGSTNIIGTEIDTEDNVTWYSGIIEAGAATGTLREVGLFDNEGNLCFVGNVPDIILPEPAEGVAINIPIQLGVKNYYSRFISIQTHIKVIEQIEGSGGYSLFDLVQKDHILSYEESEGFALQGTYVYKDGITGERYGYPDFIKTCIDEKNSEDTVIRRITLGENTITGYVNPNGHIYYSIADKAKVDAYYEQYGVAWFWGIDEENETVFLPRNNYFFKSSSVDPGTFNPATLPSLAHNHNLTIESSGLHSHGVNLGEAGAHSHSISIYEAGSHSHAFSGKLQEGCFPASEAIWRKNKAGTQTTNKLSEVVNSDGKKPSFPSAGLGPFYAIKNGANTVSGNSANDVFDNDFWGFKYTPAGSIGTGGNHSHNANISTAEAHTHPITIIDGGSHSHEGIADSKEIVSQDMLGDTVTPPSINLLLYIVVGNVRRKFAMVIDQAVEEGIERIEEAAAAGVQEIDDEVESGKTELNNTLDSAKEDINNLAQEVEDHIAADVDAAKDYAEASEYWADQSEYWAGISTQGQQQADWNQTDPTKVDYIKNKPQVDWGNLVYLNSNQTLTNKTIDASQNTVSNLGFNSLAQSLVITSLGEGVVSNTTLATSQAIWQAIKNIVIKFNNLDSSLVLTALNKSSATTNTLATSKAIIDAIYALPTANMSVLTSLEDVGSISNSSVPTSLAVYTAILRAISGGMSIQPGDGIKIDTDKNTVVDVDTSRAGLKVQSIYTGTQPEVGTLNFVFKYKGASSRLETQVSTTSSNPNLIVTCYYTGTQPSAGVITHTFTYMSNEYGTYWAENGEAIELSEYELSVVGTPQANDTITLTYTTTSIEIPAHWENSNGSPISLSDYYLVITEGTPQANDTINLTYTTTATSIISVDVDQIADLLDFKDIKGNPNYVFVDGVTAQAKLRTETLISTNQPNLDIVSTYTGTQSQVGTVTQYLSYIEDEDTHNTYWINGETEEQIDPQDYYLEITGTPEVGDRITITYNTKKVTEVSSNIEFTEGMLLTKSKQTRTELVVSDPDLTVISTYTGTQPEIGTITHKLTYELEDSVTTTETTVESSPNIEVESTFVGHKDQDGTQVQHFLYSQDSSLVTNTSIECTNPELQIESTLVGDKDTTGTLVYHFVYESYTSSSETRYGWFLEDLDLINLADYDLEITSGTPQVGDTITLTYVTTSVVDYRGWVLVETEEHVDLEDYDLEIVSGTPEINDFITVTYVTTTESVYHWVNERSQEIDLEDYDLEIVSGTPQEDDTINIAYITSLGKITVSLDAVTQTPATSSSAVATTEYVRNLQTYQPYTTFTGGSIVLQDDISVYAASSNISSATTFTFNTNNLHYLSGSMFYTFELKFTLSTVSTLTFPSNVVWQDNESPDFSNTGTYLLVFRTLDNGSHWVGNVQGYWS